MKIAANVSRVIQHMDFLRIGKKVPETLRCFVLEKLTENDLQLIRKFSPLSG
jgi:hypothetical protein